MRKFTALVLLLVLVLSLGAPALAAGELQHEYASGANSGIRHEICTTLAGTSASSYYTGSYSYGTLRGLSGDSLLDSLRDLMTQTHSYQTTYDQCRDMANKTDCENGDGQTINLTYSSFVSNMGQYINNTKQGWNREHIWPKSLGGFNNTGAGADLHHIRPTDSSINGQRGNEKYGIPSSGHAVTGTVVTGNALGGHSDNTYFEPLDNVKGDVARICLYVYVRYGGELSKCSSITNVFQSVDVLLEWMELDPVDTWEMGRNEVVQEVQGNRNVFIDYPELAWLLFNKEIPADLQCPSGGKVDSCAAGHNYGIWAVETPASQDAAGLRVRSCLDCGHKDTQKIPSWSTCAHNFSQWMDSDSGSFRYCDICSYVDRGAQNTAWIWIVIAALGVAATVTVVIIVVKKKK